jgi:hypothetical protein
MATETLESAPFQITSQQLPGLTKPLNFKTVTTFDKDSNGKIIDGTQKTTLRYQVTPGGIFQDVATSTEGGKAGSFTLINAANSNTPILGASAIQSLQTPNGVLNQATQNSIISAATKANIPSAQQQAIADKLRNVAPPPPTTVQQVSATIQGALETGKEEGISNTNIKIDANYRRDYDNYYYPKDLETNKQDVIRFSMLRIAGSSIKPNFEAGTQVITRTFINDIKGSVTLPVQPSITDNNTVDWSGGTLNAIQAYAAAAGINLIGSNDVADLGTQVGTILGQIAKEITTNGNNAQALKIFFAQEAVGIQNLLSRTSGAILNSNLELLFNGPSLRPFSFAFRLSPRDESEANQVRQIIRFFKQGMSVKTSSSNIFLQSPNIFRIRYLTWDGKKYTEHPSINRIKRCALLSCDVDYTPDGTYMTYNDPRRTMTSYGMTLRFSELEPIYEDDYGGERGSGTTETTQGRPLANDEIGY